MNKLCVDIGGSRIKFALLADQQPLPQLIETPVKSIPSHGWLNKSLPNLLGIEWPGLFFDQVSLREVDTIALSVATNVDQSGHIVGDYWRGRGVPADLKSEVERITHKDTKVVNDGIAWLQGIERITEVRDRKTLAYPVVFIGLGTGVALAIASKHSSMSSIEISDLRDITWNNLSKFKKFDGPWRVHELIGKPFFDWTDKNEPKWTFQEMRDQFTRRLIAFLQDCRGLFDDYRTICIGGGNADFISRSLLCKEISHHPEILVVNQSFARTPDIVPLVGLLQT